MSLEVWAAFVVAHATRQWRLTPAISAVPPGPRVRAAAARPAGPPLHGPPAGVPLPFAPAAGAEKDSVLAAALTAWTA
jgi:hypothetical protein